MLAISSVVAARALGPANFGRASLVVLTANLMMTLCILGLDGASTRVIGRARTLEAARHAVTTSASVVLALIVVMGTAIAAGSPLLASLISSSTTTILASILMGVALTVRFHTDKFSAALGRFRLQMWARIAEGAVVLCGIVILWFAHEATWVNYVGAVAGGAAIGAGVLVATLRRYFHPWGVKREDLRELWAFSKWGLFATVFALAMVFGDKYVIQHQLGPAALGRYVAYQTISITVMGQIMTIVSNALLPMVIKAPDKRPIVWKMWRLAKLSVVPLVAGLFLLTTIGIRFFGHGFGVSWSVAAGFSVFGTLYLLNGLFRNIVIPFSERTYFVSINFQIVRSIVFVICLFVLVKTDYLSLASVVWSLVFIEVLESWNFSTIIRRHVLDNSPAHAS